MKQLRRVLLLATPVLAALSLAACRHELAIEGQGDIVELVAGVRGCSLDEYQVGSLSNCTDNDVFQDETVTYRGLPRPGWRFSHWDGTCSQDSPGDDCLLNYKKNSADIWDELSPDKDLPPLTAVFTQDGNTLQGASYIASNLGAQSSSSYAALLDALFTDAGNYRYTTQQAASPATHVFERNEKVYVRARDGLLQTGSPSASLINGGAATQAMDFITLVDTGGSDISVAFVSAKQSDASVAKLVGTYYCGHISSWAPGYSRFFRAVFDGQGTGAQVIISDRFGRQETSGMSYTVASDGTMTLDMASFGYLNTNVRNMRLAGSLSADGNVFVGIEASSSGRGTGACIRASANQTLGTVAGNYYGAWINLDPNTKLTDFLVDVTGQTLESPLRDSSASYSLDQNFMLVKFDGQLETQDTFGAVSPDNRILFIVDTNGNRSPRLSVYIRKT